MDFAIIQTCFTMRASVTIHTGTGVAIHCVLAGGTILTWITVALIDVYK